ncbi:MULTISPECIES: EAL domain-containing protein [Bacillus]|uniref:EAL domain-containing protein n=1 Tax=Bacillus TaxID=1386 RepID=UPI00083CE126|nr:MULTISPECIES: EAL-associated domain-containing protein [Bacillus]AVX17640.1 diguanylate phosphodiesterase [Bacillus sp. ZY-1-1]MDF3255812.1 EAL-associated domain-containing protein [Bacillus velezensis]MDF3266958.1 EAL-associated domain-containing protein [Bacillus velezensis]MDY7903432.1 EAL-associated domain-containing protein [Bacillus sp. AG1]MEC3675734.1 EAL-associated domain-containing protein [Bacillus velezensis]
MLDPLDILTNIDDVIPYYQAIFNAEEQRVVGYEVLGRILADAEIESLGPFFLDSGIPEEYKLEVDDRVIRQALKRFKEADRDLLIFINQDANVLMLDHGESFLELLKEYEEQGIELNRIVLEITEHNFEGDIEQLYHMLAYYRTYGIKIAVDNIGKESSNLDRIALLSPDLLKIDLQALKVSQPSPSYEHVLYSISLLARKIGAALLYEDIEADFQLQYAWRNGGRFFQGYYLQAPSGDFIDRSLLKARLKTEFQQFITREKKKLETVYEHSENFYKRVNQAVSELKKTHQADDEFIKKLAENLTDCCFRIYMCDEEGYQLTGNVFKQSGEWLYQPEYVEKNWSWRPYFLENIMKMRNSRKGFFSDLYSDIETGEMIRTFSYPMDDNMYLFIDLPYSYLYEQDGLL